MNKTLFDFVRKTIMEHVWKKHTICFRLLRGTQYTLYDGNTSCGIK